GRVLPGQLDRARPALGEQRVTGVGRPSGRRRPVDAAAGPLRPRARGRLLGPDEHGDRGMVGRLAPERARALWRLVRALVPPGGGQHEQPLGAGAGHVEEAALVLEGALGEGRLEGAGVAGESWQVAGVLTELVREALGAPRIGDAYVREDAVLGRAVLPPPGGP